ncbi:heme-binding protein 2-like [Pelobates fuscus]|uniref:heme-binding protein 2-like n=1 Tax=Pelobates fuscus TaxID=191477 RepID=UPI002FE4B8E3
MIADFSVFGPFCQLPAIGPRKCCHDVGWRRVISTGPLPSAGSQNFEHRTYKPTNWITTIVDKSRDVYDTENGFLRLNQYTNGSNVKGISVETGQPVMLFVPIKKGQFATISYFLPPGVDAPKPLISNVFHETFTEVSLYIRTLQRSAVDSDIYRLGNILQKMLISQKKSFDGSFIGCCLYDGPDKSSRHIEVFFMAI